MRGGRFVYAGRKGRWALTTVTSSTTPGSSSCGTKCASKCGEKAKYCQSALGARLSVAEVSLFARAKGERGRREEEKGKGKGEARAYLGGRQ